MTVPVPPGGQSPAAFPSQVPRITRANPVLLSNSADGGTPGQAVTPGNSGGASGDAFDGFGGSGQFVYDSTYLVHGPGAWRVSTGAAAAQAYVAWSTSLQKFPESPPAWQRLWFRFYLYVPSLPAANNRLAAFFDPSAVQCGGLVLLTTGQVRWFNAAGGSIQTSATVLPTAQWVRIEGYISGSPSSGQAETRIFLSADSTVADEIQTSAATANTLAPIGITRLGQSAGGTTNYGPLWFDEWAVSTGGYIGPVTGNPPAPTQRIYLPPEPPGFLSPMAWQRAQFPRVSGAAATPPAPLATPPPLIAQAAATAGFGQPGPAVTARNSLQDFATPVTPAPVVVPAPNPPGWGQPAGGFISRSSLADAPVLTTPAPVVAMATAVTPWGRPQAAVIAANPAAPVAVAAAGTPQPVIVAQQLKAAAAQPPIIVRSSLADLPVLTTPPPVVVMTQVRPPPTTTVISVAPVITGPPPFTIGALSASTAPTTTQAPADRAANTLTASGGPSGGTLTATDQRTGGPG